MKVKDILLQIAETGPPLGAEKVLNSNGSRSR